MEASSAQFRSCNSKITVVGLGRLGTPLALVLANAGHDVVGVDSNPETVARLAQGIAPEGEPQLQDLLASAGERFRTTGDLARAISTSDLSFIVVPTPSEQSGNFSNALVESAVAEIGAALRPSDRYHAVNVVSTVMPGSMARDIAPALERASGKTVGRDLGLNYCPAFIALGRVVKDLRNPDFVLIGESDRAAGDKVAAVCRSIIESEPPFERMNWMNAEIVKLAINTFVTMKISYANTLMEICEGLPTADADRVTAAVGKDRRIGAGYLKPGLGFGGPCFPRDGRAFEALARTLGADANLASATAAINERQADRVVAFVKGIAAAGARVTVLGLAYKPGTPIVESSQATIIASDLAKAGFAVTAFDPVANEAAQEVIGGSVGFSVSIADAIADAEIVLVATPDPDFAALRVDDLPKRRPLPVFVDCWRILPEPIQAAARVLYLGMGPPNDDSDANASATQAPKLMAS